MYRGKHGRIMFEEKDIEQLKTLYEGGHSQVSISKIMGVNHNRIREIMKENKIRVRTDREQALQYKCNENFFDVIDTEQKAYWLGFIYADGYIVAKRKHNSRKLGIAISEKDVELLKRFKKDIESTHPIGKYESTASSFEGSYPYVRVIISSSKIAEDLFRLGVFEQKTEKIQFPTENQVPKRLIHHFIRGYFDGDGSISQYQKKSAFTISFCGTREFLDGLQNYFGTSLKLDKRHDNNVNNYSLGIGGNRQVEEILDDIYKDATVFLMRKHNRYIDLKEQNKKMDVHLSQQQIEREQEKDYIISEYHKVKNIAHLANQLGMSTTKVGDTLRDRKIMSYL